MLWHPLLPWKIWKQLLWLKVAYGLLIFPGFEGGRGEVVRAMGYLSSLEMLLPVEGGPWKNG